MHMNLELGQLRQYSVEPLEIKNEHGIFRTLLIIILYVAVVFKRNTCRQGIYTNCNDDIILNIPFKV